MKLNNLNMTCSDTNGIFDFSSEKGTFDDEKGRINSMRILLSLKGSLAIVFENDEGSPFAKLSVS